ncbi:hypothetical protein [Burkholderia catarinensis]|uniref:hypothetical protein n=1 Tax=Burkholderia catarinensis TaxID=1108140 RepID=UPI0010085DE9|nr:hypothetical protein [Burkholderia catarinensis]
MYHLNSKNEFRCICFKKGFKKGGTAVGDSSFGGAAAGNAAGLSECRAACLFASSSPDSDMAVALQAEKRT